jgi:hypothetical protein
MGNNVTPTGVGEFLAGQLFLSDDAPPEDGRRSVFGPKSVWALPHLRHDSHAGRGIGACGHPRAPRGFYLQRLLSLAGDAPDGLAIHPDQALDFSLAPPRGAAAFLP